MLLVQPVFTEKWVIADGNVRSGWIEDSQLMHTASSLKGGQEIGKKFLISLAVLSVAKSLMDYDVNAVPNLRFSILFVVASVTLSRSVVLLQENRGTAKKSGGDEGAIVRSEGYGQ